MKAEAEELESGNDEIAHAQSDNNDANPPVADLEDTEGVHDDEAQSAQASTIVDSSAETPSTSQDDADGGTDQAKKKKASEETAAPPLKKRPAHAENLIGKMNNLVTSDLIKIIDGCDFLTIGECFAQLSHRTLFY